MKLLYLHGPPAAGKYTVGAELARRRGWRFLHNHLTMDVASAVLDFGAPGYWELVHELRIAAIRAAAASGEPVLVVTGCYDHPADLPAVEAFEAAAGELVPVYLRCGREELEARVGAPTRAAMGKLETVEGLANALARWNCVALPRAGCLTVVTEGRTPEACADEILERTAARLEP